jgi:tRNA nucleotidyltransferase (CCA-adding enzyme)
LHNQTSQESLILGKTPKDYDICTQATPDEVMSIFEPTHKVIPTGVQYGTVTLIAEDFYIKNAIGIPIEVTTFRKDGDYLDGRRPNNVEFSKSAEEDVLRRDFTMNGLLYDGDKIIDHVHGLIHIEQKIITTIHNPTDRFKEDALRMMRCVRFACQLGFKIKECTYMGILFNAELIKNISQERIRDELIKILLSKCPSKGIKMLQETRLLKYILPELEACYGFDQQNPNHNKDVFKHTLDVLEHTPDNIKIRLAALLHDIGKPQTFTVDQNGVGNFYKHHLKGYDLTQDILKRLKFDNKTIENVSILVKEHMSIHPHIRKNSIKKLINRIGKNNIDDLINLQIADIIGSKPPYDFKNIIDLKEEIYRVLNEKEPLSIKDLNINGYDLINMGMESGKQIGEILNKLLEMVLENPELNMKDILLKEVKIMLKRRTI